MKIPSQAQPPAEPSPLLWMLAALIAGQGSLAATGQGAAKSAVIGSGRAARTELQEDMAHPLTAWTDPEHARLPLSRLTQEYTLHLRGRTNATTPATIRKYEATLKSFRESLRYHGDEDELGSVTPFAVNRWVADQRAAGLTEQGIAGRLSSLKVFVNGFVFRYLELTTVDLLRKVPRSQVPPTPVQGLNPQEVEQVMEHLGGFTFEDVRNRAFVSVMMATGLRLNEVVGLKLTDLDRLSGEIVVLGKGQRTRTVRLSSRALKALREYLRLRTPQVEGDPMWLTATGKRFSYWGASSLFRRLQQTCGVPRLHAHLLRHTFAQTALLKGADRGAVQDMLGHATDAMTRRYSGEVRQRLAAQQMPQVAPL